MQSIPDGTTVRFRVKDVSHEEFAHFEPGLNLDELDGSLAKVTALATATEEGNKDYEYYDIEFPDGTKLEAISGYHLDPVEKESTSSEGNSNLWHCPRCGHEVVASSKPEPIKWTDGHTCRFVPGSGDNVVAHDFIPSSAPESMDTKTQAQTLVKQVMERARGVNEMAYDQIEKPEGGEGGPFAPGGLDDQASAGVEVENRAVKAVVDEVNQWHAGQVQDLLDALVEMFGDHEMLNNMDAPAIQNHLREASRILGERTGD